MAETQCGKCGTQLPEGVNFCPKCGAPAGVAPAPEQGVGTDGEVQTKEKKHLFGSILFTLRVFATAICGIAAAVALLFPRGHIVAGIVVVIACIAFVIASYSSIKTLPWIIFVICFGIALVYGFLPIAKDEEFIDQVREGQPFDLISNMSYGMAFNKMFSSGEWNCDRSENTVVYDGIYEHDGYGEGDENVRFVYAVDPDSDTFQLTQLYVNGDLLEEEYAASLEYAVFQINDIYNASDSQLPLKDLAYVAGVWYSESYDHPGVTIYEAFNAFFSSCDWRYDGDGVVAFSGEYDDGGYTYKIILEFLDEGNGVCSFQDIYVNGTYYGSYAASVAIDEIFEHYDDSGEAV